MSESGSLKLLRIFIACPGDIVDEKQHVIAAIAGLQDHAEQREYILRHLEWGQCIPDMGRASRLSSAS